MTPVIFHNMPRAEYDALPALNQSTLKKFGNARSPLHFKKEKPRKETAELRIGNAVDCLLFTPNDYAEKFSTFCGHRRGKVWEEFEAANNWKTILTETEFARVEGCIASLKKEQDFCDAMRACKFQVAAVAQHPTIEGAWMKALLDMLPVKANGFAFDLKTADSAHPEDFIKQCGSLGYNLQAFWYLRILRLLGQETERFGFFVVENDEPFAVNRFVTKWDSPEMRQAQERIDKWAENYLICRNLNVWPGYSGGWNEIVFPDWALRKAA